MAKNHLFSNVNSAKVERNKHRQQGMGAWKKGVLPVTGMSLLHMENTHQVSSIHSFNRHCQRVTSISGPVLGIEDTVMSQTRKVSAQHGVSHQ